MKYLFVLFVAVAYVFQKPNKNKIKESNNKKSIDETILNSILLL